MVFFKLMTALALANTLAEAIPTASQGRFSVQQQATGRRKFKSGAIEMEKAFKKFKKAVPESIKAASIAAVQGSVTATPEQFDEAYLCPVSVGTAAQSLMMDFDTGSSDFWVFCSEMPAAQRSGHEFYTPSSSSTSRLESGETWDITFGDGSSARGVVFADKVVIGGVTATSQAVECATSVSSTFVSDTANDGLVGLAFNSINTVSPNQASTFFFTVEPTLTTSVFAADLKHNAPGVYDFGFIDTTKFTGSLTFVPVNNANGFWEFTASGFSVGNQGFSDTLDCIADTGTTLALLPLNVIKLYYAQVAGAKNSAAQGGFIFPCSSTLPNFSMTIGGVSHTIPGSFINFAPVSSTTCFGGLQSSAGIGFNILGDIFLKSQYVVFDGGNTRIGFAQQ